MRNGYNVYDRDTHIGQSADSLEKYLSSRVRELAPDLESRKVPQKRHAASIEYDPPYPERFRLSRGGSVGGWGADVPRVLGEAEPRATAGGASGRFMGSKYPNLNSDDWDVDGRVRDPARVRPYGHARVCYCYNRFRGRSGHGDPSLRCDRLQGLDGRQHYRHAEPVAEERSGGVDVRHVTQDAWPQGEAVERVPVAAHGGFGLGRTRDVVPDILGGLLTRGRDHLMHGDESLDVLGHDKNLLDRG
jgi:hypothetical protein